MCEWNGAPESLRLIHSTGFPFCGFNDDGARRGEKPLWKNALTYENLNPHHSHTLVCKDTTTDKWWSDINLKLKKSKTII